MFRATPSNSNYDAWDFSDNDNEALDSSSRLRNGDESLTDLGFANTKSKSPKDADDSDSYFFPRSSNFQYEAAEFGEPARHSNQLYSGSEDPRLSNRLCSQLEDPRSSSQLYSELENPRSSNFTCTKDPHSSLILSHEVDQNSHLSIEDEKTRVEQNTTYPASYICFFDSDDQVRKLEAYRELEAGLAEFCEVMLQASIAADKVLTGTYFGKNPAVCLEIIRKLNRTCLACDELKIKIKERQYEIFSWGGINETATTILVRRHAKQAIQAFLWLVCAVRDVKDIKSPIRSEMITILRHPYQIILVAARLIKHSPWSDGSRTNIND